MTLALKTLGAAVLVMMTLSSAFMPMALAAGSISNTFGDGSLEKDALIPVGGGDSTGIYLKLLPSETVKGLGLTLSPKATTINRSLEVPLNEGFDAGTFADKYVLADNTGLQAKLYSFKHIEYFIDDKGIDLSNTTANVLFEEGINGVALSVNRSANFTTVLESPHVSNAVKVFDWGGRLIKNLTVNASGNSPGTVSGLVRAWNTQTRKWDSLFNIWNMGGSISHVTMVQQNYTVPIYSRLDVQVTSFWGGTQWYNLNVTYEGFNNRSIVTSAPIDPVKDHGWDPSWTVSDCRMDATRDLPANTHLSFELSSDNGTTWESAISGGDHTFTQLGNIVRWRANLSADATNVTPILRSLTLMCRRNIDPADYSWQSRSYHIDEGAFVSYSISWTGTTPPGTAVSAVAQRSSQDPILNLVNGAVGSFDYNQSLHNISFSVFLSPTLDRTPLITKLVLNYTVEVRPSDVAIDVGNDGTIEWSRQGELENEYRINGSDAKAMIGALNSKVSHTGGTVNVPLRVLSSTGSSVTLHDLNIEYGLPPELKARIGMISLNEDTNRTSVLSLYDYFTDDYDPLDLTFSVSYMEGPTKVLSTIRGSEVDISLPTKYWNGPSIIRFRATDQDGTSTESNDVTVMVWPVDAPPVITYVPTDVPAYVGAPFLGQVKAFDPEGRNITFHLDQGPFDAQIDITTGLIFWRPLTNKTQSFIVNISDISNFVQARFNLTPVVNYTKASPPVFVTVPIIKARVDERYIYDAEAVDLDQDPLEFQLIQYPEGMKVGPDSGLVQWLPSEAQLGYNNVTLRATDGAFIADQNFRVLVINSQAKNKPPQISSTPPEGAWVSKPYMYQIKAKDPDAGTMLLYQLVLGPKTMSLDDGGRILWVPTANDIGEQSVKVMVDDGVVQVPQSWTISVYTTDRTCIISTPAPSTIIKDKLMVRGLANGPNNITRVEVRIGDENNWMKAAGTNKWHLELNTSNLGTGYHNVMARACDDVTCSKESEVRFYHQGSGSSLGAGISPYWYAVILVIIIIVVVLLIDLKMKFIKGPRDRIKMDDEDLELEDDDRSVYHNKDR
jgi:hypothetical protein